MSPVIILLVEVVAFWPVWPWWVSRLTGEELTTGPLALLVLGALLFRRAENPGPPPLRLLATLLVLSALTHHLLPPLLRGALAFTTLAITLSWWRRSTLLHVPTWGLAMLALPVMPSLQFFLGHPLRALSAALAVPLLRMAGLDVTREGTTLTWESTQVWVDAPCSGLRMLWTGLFLAFILADVLGLDRRRSVVLVALSLGAVVVGNAWRASTLFYLETGLVTGPEWLHQGVGVVVFMATCALIALVGWRVRPCAWRPS
ncbi:MAG: archaeosortase/exosortase family protein [Myxococcota bacterium]